jgi:L-arabinonolactonase
MYLADSPTRKIFVYAYDAETGTLSDKKLVHERAEGDNSVPDGSCVDSEGYLWNAVWRHDDRPSCVQRIDPSSGRVVFTVHIPDSTGQVSCCCFGGENMDILFITSAATGKDKKKQPHAGALYAAKVPFRGRKEPRLKFTY